MAAGDSVMAWIGLNECKGLQNVMQLLRIAAAECIGTLVLVFVGCGTCLGGEWESKTANPTSVQISLAFGIIVATMVWSVGHISGGHINPAVTFGMLVTRHVSLIRAAVYIVAQSIGAVLGALILAGVTKKASWGNLGMTTIAAELSTGQGFGIELMITFILVFTVFASCDKRRSDLNGSTPLTIGLCVSACHMFAIKCTGSSMNPARSLGPVVILSHYPAEERMRCFHQEVTGDLIENTTLHATTRTYSDDCLVSPWENHWVYWFGPICGGILAGLLYELLFAANASMGRSKALLTCQPYDTEEYDVSHADAVDSKPVRFKKTDEGEVALP